MATLTIRQIDEGTKAALRRRAAEHGRSMEAEVRAILASALSRPEPGERGLGTRIHQSFATLGGVDLDLPARTERPRPAPLWD